MVDEYAIETSQLLIEREARILADYKIQTDAGKDAWRRYYWMIYRDNYSRLDYLSALLKRRLIENGNPNDAPKRLLSWVQGFEYLRTGGASDLLSPITSAANKQGDCDTRALLYIILLNHYGIDSSLMVSAEYSHAMAAVAMEGPGYGINIGERLFLVAETTDDVDIGMIAADMTDVSKWQIIPLMEKEPWN